MLFSQNAQCHSQKTFYETVNLDKLVKSQKTSFFVIPAKAGIQCFQKLMTDLDPGLRRGDDFLRVHQPLNFNKDWAKGNFCKGIETFEKRDIFLSGKEGKNFNRRNTLCISRIKIRSLTPHHEKMTVLQRSRIASYGLYTKARRSFQLNLGTYKSGIYKKADVNGNNKNGR